jgi:uncharacterized protein
MIQRVVKDGALAIAQVREARTLAARMWGLLGRRRLPVQTALHIVPCNAIHTCWMLFSLDVVFLNRDWTVVRIVRNVRPFRFVLGGQAAHSVLEMTAGWLEPNALRVGDRVVFETATGRPRG